MRSLVRLVTACASQLARVRVRLVAFRHSLRSATGIANTGRVPQQASRTPIAFRNRSRFATGRVSQQVAFRNRPRFATAAFSQLPAFFALAAGGKVKCS